MELNADAKGVLLGPSPDHGQHPADPLGDRLHGRVAGELVHRLRVDRTVSDGPQNIAVVGARVAQRTHS
jgi:hypothetical protein